jgi:hypothetical protein
MKKLYTFFIALIAACSASSQAVLNELYVYPSPTNHEFFELYNTSTSGTPMSVDGYFLMSYFKDANEEGFYIIDLPNLSMQPKGFLVGSSAIPFNYQGNTINLGSTASDFSWNDPSLVTNYGYVKKWVRTKNVDAADGNPYYNEEPLPADFNDFFSRKGGSGASYNAFLFKDGMMINSFVGGSGGNSLIPDFITLMPLLNVQNVTALGNNPYTVDFSNYNNTQAEFVIQDVGTDNGYMRETDGLCGSWEKSSSQAFHTPQTTNGAIQMDDPGLLTITTHISRALTEADPSFIVYNVTAGPAYMFPVDLYIYADNGSVPNVWDANDVFIGGSTETIVTDGPFTTNFEPKDQQLILVAKTAPGCYDQVRLIPNPEPITTTLPLKLTMFTGKVTENKSLLEWVVTGNESGLQFEIERSVNGKDFTKAGVIAASDKEDKEYYTFQESLNGNAYYRLKIINKDKSFTHSPVVFVKDGTVAADKLFVVQNPVEASLIFTYQSTQTEQSTINIYNALGLKLLSTQRTAQKGSNTYTINLDQKFASGTYILEVVSTQTKSVERFIRR